MPRRLGDQTLAILGAVLHQDKTALHIAEELRLSKAGIYTQLARLVDSGLLKGYYREEDLERRRGKPQRWYRITGTGEFAARGIIAPGTVGGH